MGISLGVEEEEKAMSPSTQNRKLRKQKIKLYIYFDGRNVIFKATVGFSFEAVRRGGGGGTIQEGKV